MLAGEYEHEQKELKVKITELDDLIENGETQTKDLKQLLVNVRKYTDPKELTAQMVNDLVDKIIVHAPDKSSGHRKQKIEIYYNAVGIIDLPTVKEGRLHRSSRQMQRQKDSRMNSKRQCNLFDHTASYIKLRYGACAKALSVFFIRAFSVCHQAQKDNQLKCYKSTLKAPSSSVPPRPLRMRR